MNLLQIYIISWFGMHENARFIARTLMASGFAVTITYSDPDPNFIFNIDCALIRRPNEFFWADKFNACITSCSSELMLVIHADTECDNWSLLARNCQLAMVANPIIGVWAPLIDNTPYILGKTSILQISQSPLHIVAQTDGIIFCLSKNIILRMRQASYFDNLYGWGIDQLFVAHAFSTGKLVVVDSSISIRHSQKRGYLTTIAEKQWLPFLNKNFSPSEMASHLVLQSFVRNRNS